jgi:hypothetical protein
VSCLFSLKDDNEQFKKIKKDKSHCLSDAAWMTIKKTTPTMNGFKRSCKSRHGHSSNAWENTGLHENQWCYLAQVNTHRQPPLKSAALTWQRSCFMSAWSLSVDEKNCFEKNVMTRTHKYCFILFLFIILSRS